ncbi:MAG: HD domain-containing protein [Nitrospira sp.]|nr:MAG: HD domain-containing protein [Nitrospira sp.]
MSLGLSQRFEHALTFTARLHATQTRKGTEIPYIAHLLAVASLVLTHGGDEDEAIAGLLHDAVEDQGGRHTLEIIRARFGERIAAIVDGCMDTDITPKPPWRERKVRYLHHLKAASPSVKLVAAADKLDNVRSILADHRTLGPSIWTRFNAGKADQQWFYRGCVTALVDGKQSIIRELDVAVEELERL